MRSSVMTVTCDRCGAEAVPDAGDWTVDCPKCFTRLAVRDESAASTPEPAPESGAIATDNTPARAARPRARHTLDTAPRCKHHYTTPALVRCDRCEAPLCHECLVPREVRGIAIEMCPCGGRTERLSDEERGAAPTCARQLGTSFGYPLVEPGRTMLLAGSLFLTAAGFLASVNMLGFVIEFFVAGFLSAYLLKIISVTTTGEDTPPEWPSVESLWEGVAMPLLRLAAVTVLYLGPAVASSIHFGPLSPLTLIAIAGGCFLMPMALLALAVYRTAGAMNPIFLLGSIARAPAGYTQAAGLLLLAVVASGVAEVAASWLPWIGPVLSFACSLYLLMVTGRMLGLHYRLHESELGWF